MTGSAPHCSIVLCWYIISPLLLVYSPFSFGSYSYPTWAVVMAWVIASLPLICIPIGMAHALYRTSSISLVKLLRLRLTVTPTEDDSVHGNRNLELKHGNRKPSLTFPILTPLYVIVIRHVFYVSLSPSFV
ncbi:hypothetical protein KUTeg_012364 [Tegillarca granosa]|uniref:Uncharacterized protein n=1 Tax=Tegillarca granosa TaxID=220873 RepID=A0ABQ9EZI6_TEGGR|nr:hypothetical protein KUTeg_012364 [Tegillarca granosa]